MSASAPLLIFQFESRMLNLNSHGILIVIHLNQKKKPFGYTDVLHEFLKINPVELEMGALSIS